VRPTGIEPVTYGLAYHYSFHCQIKRGYHQSPPFVCGLDYIFAISGGARIVSTDPNNNDIEQGPTYHLAKTVS